MEKDKALDELLVNIFNNVMAAEEKIVITDEFKDLTMNDVHVIEAIGVDKPQTMTEISGKLGITMGTLTISINSLVRKGYAVRTRGIKDKRIVYASLTDKGNAAYKVHQSYHKAMAAYVINGLSDDEAAALLKAMQVLQQFIDSEAPRS